MIYEMRTYTLKVNKVPEAEKLFAAALPERVKVSPLGAFFHAETGTLNQVVHIWPYEGLAHLEKVREGVAKLGRDKWPPPGLTDLIVKMESDFLQPAPFMRPWSGQMRLGDIYELRTYDLLPGSRGRVLEEWAKLVNERERFSPLAGCWVSYGNGGVQNKLYHLWPYRDMNERTRLRAEAFASGKWPPNSAHYYERMESKILVPAAFSPLR